MMQISETSNQKHSLFNTMNRFIGAVNNMDQTVMVPSLLRDVPLDDEREMTAIKSTGNSDVDDGDMYSYYQLLKSIRQDIELGVRRAEERRMESVSMKVSRSDSEDSSEDSEEEDDLKKQFQFHMTGLHGVLSKLTQQAHILTNRYKQEIGIGGWGQ